MNGAEFVAALKKSFGASSNSQLATTVGVTAMTISNWENSKKISARIVASLVHGLVDNSLPGASAIEAIKRKLDANTDADAAAKLGITPVAVGQWRKRATITARQFAGLVASSKLATQRSTEAGSVRPLVEFFPVKKSKSGKKFEVFSPQDNADEPHPYLEGLKLELESESGVYIFFDSRGQAIYAGKARKQKLWKELNLAFNRDRKDLQLIRRVRHPSRQVQYRPANEKARQITEHSVPLHELAYYLSAYQVSDGMVNGVEALLVRSFANNLLNKRMEKFGEALAKKKRKKKKAHK